MKNKKDKMGWTKEELINMDEVEFRARFRERCHHTMEIAVYEAAYNCKSLSPKQKDTAILYIHAWNERGLSQELPEYKYVSKLIEYADKLILGEKVSFNDYKPTILKEDDVKAFENVVYERRSVRHWKNDDVPDELIEKIIKAGNWAAHGCNLQSIRYAIIREKEAPGLFKGSDIPGGPVHIVICQDMRNYTIFPDNWHNILLDCGAAAQNIVLATHAYGLGGCWLTYTSEEMRNRIEKYIGLPPEIRFVTYVDIGWPDQTPIPPLRRSVEESIVFRN